MDIDLDSPTPKDQISAIEQFTPSHRIQDLNEIDVLISSLLSSASSAISLLSSSSDSNTQSHSQPQTLETIQSQFQTHSKNYFTTLSTIEVRLRRQVYALEEANLIPAGTERDTRRGRNLAGASGASAGAGDSTTGGGAGGGPLDPSWLNARIDNGVEEGKKRELLETGKAFVEEMRRDRRKNENKEEGG